jgi:peroxiredoxin
MFRKTGRGWLTVFLLVFLFFSSRAGAVTLSAGDMAPNFSLKDIDGNTVTLDQFRDKTVVVAFWSVWCSRCEEEMTFLRDNFGTREDVVVLLVNQDSEKEVDLELIRTIREKLRITFPILLDEGLALWDHLGINALPTSMVVDKEGKITYIEANFYWASPEKLLEAVGPG